MQKQFSDVYLTNMFINKLEDKGCSYKCTEQINGRYIVTYNIKQQPFTHSNSNYSPFTKQTKQTKQTNSIKDIIMKSILLSLLIFAALVLTGCNTNTTSNFNSSLQNVTTTTVGEGVSKTEDAIPTANPYSSVGGWLYNSEEALMEFGHEFTCRGLTTDNMVVYFYCDLEA